MLKKYDAVVIFGGKSSENEVSVITGTMVCNVLKKGGERVLPVYIDHDGRAYAGDELADVGIYSGGGYKRGALCSIACGGVTLYKRRGVPYRHVGADCIVNCCHGGPCEGGAVAGAAALAGIPLASAGIFESAVFMDKYFTKLVLKSLGVKVAEYAFARDEEGALSAGESLGYPLVVKPASLGSSIGIAVARSPEELKEALGTAFSLDGGVLLEEYLSPRREINCAAYFADGEVVCSQLEEVSSSGEVLSYDDKYAGGGSRTFPAQLDGGLSAEITAITERVYASLGMRGIVRFDYIIADKDGPQIYLSEINTVPGSLSQYLVSGSYGGFYKVLKGVIAQAVADFNEAQGRRVIRTGILNNIRSNTCKLK